MLTARQAPSTEEFRAGSTFAGSEARLIFRTSLGQVANWKNLNPNRLE